MRCNARGTHAKRLVQTKIKRRCLFKNFTLCSCAMPNPPALSGVCCLIMPVVGTLGFVRWAEPSSPGDTCLFPLRVTSVLASGKFHCEFIGCGGQRTTEPLLAISLLAGDDDGYTGLGSTNAATPAPTAQRRDDPAAANPALALPSGEPRNWRVGGEDGAEEGACTLTPGKRHCVVDKPS